MCLTNDENSPPRLRKAMSMCDDGCAIVFYFNLLGVSIRPAM